MALKYSDNPIPEGDFGVDWGNDTTNGLPYSGKVIQDFIKTEIQNKPDTLDITNTVKDEIRSSIFNDGNRGIITGLEGNSEILKFTKLSYDGDTLKESEDLISIGTPDANARFLSTTLILDNSIINVGGEVNLSYGFVVTDANGDIILNSPASATLTLTKLGQATAFYSTNLGTIISTSSSSETSGSINLTSIIANKIKSSATINATLLVTYTYTYMNEDGTSSSKTITKYGTTALTVLALVLNTSINIANTGLNGQVSIPYSVKGNGNKTVYIYRNGSLIDSQDDITASSYSGVFIDTITDSGSVNYLLVAQATLGNTTVSSHSFYFDLFSFVTTPIISFLIEDSSGTIQDQNTYVTPKFKAPKFNDFKFSYYIYDPSIRNSDVIIETSELASNGNPIITTLSDNIVGRKIYYYSKRIKSSNLLKITFTCSKTTRTLYINPMASSVDIELPTESLKLNLEADGRSNEESNPATWSYGDITTDFSGLNWQSNGWINEKNESTALLLQNGAKAVIHFPLFESVNGSSVTRTGCTFELLFKCDKASLDENDIISCYWFDNNNNQVGLNVTTNYVGVYTGKVTEYKDDDGKVTLSIVTRVGSLYSLNTYYKYAFVIDPDVPSINGKGLCYGYLNGILSFIAELPDDTGFINLNKLPITIDSTYADVYIKSIKYYNQALTIDECTDSFIIDLNSSTKIEELYEDNNVLGLDESDSSYISPSKVREKGRGVIIITPAGNSQVKLQDLNKSTSKKTYFGPFRIAYWAPKNDLNLGYSSVNSKGDAFNFVHQGCMIRILGTTSTKRPRKNYRFEIAKKDSTGAKFDPKEHLDDKGFFIVGGDINDDYKYSMSQDALAVPILCAKVDYVDSSMTHNTGGALVFNELTKNIKSLRNEVLEKEYLNGGQTVNAIKTRVAIEGFPVDIFAADSVIDPAYSDTLDEKNYSNLLYMGLYNLNNDKSKSGKVFGFDGAYYYDSEGKETTKDADGAMQPICIEFLDNLAALCNFQIKFTQAGDIDSDSTYNATNFNSSLEVRAPADLTDQIADKGGLDSLESFENGKWNYVNTNIKRVFNFIAECAKLVAINNNKTAYSLNNMTSNDFESLDWTSNKFKEEASLYLKLESTLAWYIWTDYIIGVDQRAKNMMFYTMNGKLWGFLYYDGDTVLGERNDCFLAYDYLTDRDTYDYGAKLYALLGHDSWLWYLIRANFGETAEGLSLSSICKEMRSSSKFSSELFKAVFNELIVSNWSLRQYNYSQKYKYIQPLSETGYPPDIGINFINTAQGSREAHRSFILENRFNLLDSKYQAGDYTQDAFVYYGANKSDEQDFTNRITIVSSIPYYFGWHTSNTSIREHKRADSTNNFTVDLSITGNGTNNPANVLGASRIKELTFDPSASWTVDSAKSVTLNSLRKLIAKDMEEDASGELYLIDCHSLTHLDISNSKFGLISGLESSSKLEYIDISKTPITSLKVADGAPIRTMKLSKPSQVFLSNLSNLTYNEVDSDTLTAESWDNLNTLLINNCPNVNWKKLVKKFLESSATSKYLRITGINETLNITWLDDFEGIYGLDDQGNAIVGSGPLLIGELRLIDYTADEIVDNYRKKFPSITIRLPEFTMIRCDEVSEDASITNLDNNSGWGKNKVYEPSGHILNILKRVHRYLGKVTLLGDIIDFEGNPNDPTNVGKKFKGRDTNGTMMLILLADEDSNYYASGYDSNSTKTLAVLDGEQNHGEVGVYIPGFWYKGINYHSVLKANKKYNFTCYSTLEEEPSKSNEIKVLNVAELFNITIGEGDKETEGLYASKYKISTYTIDTLDNTITEQLYSDTTCNIIRINVDGYKKILFPIAAGYVSVFTDSAYKILKKSGESGLNAVSTYSLVVITDEKLSYNNMPAISTIPSEAKYFFIAVKTILKNNTNILPEYCNIVLHKGSEFDSGDSMTLENAKEWLADMEPDWVYSNPVWIAAAECANTTTSDGYTTLYSPFDVTKNKIAATGSSTDDSSINDDLNPSVNTSFNLYYFRYLAAQRGMLLIDYEASKLIAMLFMAKYGKKNSLELLGEGLNTWKRKLGTTASIGMQDTVCKYFDTGKYIGDPVRENNSCYEAYSYTKNLLGKYNYTKIDSPNFLGIENVHGNIHECLERIYNLNESDENLSKFKIIMPDNSVRRVYSLKPSLGNDIWLTSTVHGRYCDIFNSSVVNGNATEYYGDYQIILSEKYNKLSQTKGVTRSGNSSVDENGVFYLAAYYKIGYDSIVAGSRLMFRGNFNITTDINQFKAANDNRTLNHDIN